MVMKYFKRINCVLWLSYLFQHVLSIEEHAWTEGEYDFVIVGAGAAGAAVANRLSENDKYKVLLLEAGDEPLQFTKIPYFGGGPFGGELDWRYQTEKQENACLNYEDQKILIPRGKVLGGSTTLNAMVATRGNKYDYDQWEALGNKGWSYNDVLPFFKKLEDYQVPFVKEDDSAYHNTGGPVKISRPHYSSAISDAFIEGGRALGYEFNDYNAGQQTGFFKPVFTLNNSTRWSAYDAYLRPCLNRNNLQIITKAYVKKVLFDDDHRATGVVYERDGSDVTVKCKKEIILAGGAINSPHLLLLSGIGPAQTLDKFEIPLIVDLPGVGQNYRDHVGTLGVAYTFSGELGVNVNFHVNPESMESWELKRQGPLTVPIGCEGIAFIKSKYADEKIDYPDMELFMLQISRNLGLKSEAGISIGTTDEGRSVLIIIPIALRTKSTGYLSLRSSNPHDHPLIQPKLLSNNDDIDVVVEGIKFVHKLFSTEPFKKIGAQRLNKKAFGCETRNDTSDEYYKCLTNRYTTHIFHPSGTCKMGTKDDKMAVVDEKLRVYGVKNLRVVDMSISPTMLTAHTMIPAIMIGEKGAHMILEDWKDSHEEL